MARIHAMGRVRRQTFPISWKGKEIPSLPCPVYAKEKYWQLKSMIPSKPMDLSALQLFMKMQLKN